MMRETGLADENSSNRSNSGLVRLFADFNNADRKGRLRLNCRGTLDDLEALGVCLCDGLCVVLDDHDELSVRGIVRWDVDDGWVAEIDWSQVVSRVSGIPNRYCEARE